MIELRWRKAKDDDPNDTVAVVNRRGDGVWFGVLQYREGGVINTTNGTENGAVWRGSDWQDVKLADEEI